MTYRVSPGVYQRVVDLGISATQISPSIAASTFAAKRGSLGPVLVTDRQRGREIYGKADPSWGYGLDSMNAFLYEGKVFYGNRVVSNDAKYGLGLLANNKINNVAAGTSFTPVPGGSLVPYDQVNRDVRDIEVSADFATGHSAIITINTIATSSIAFSISHEDTMSRLVQAIQTVLDGLGAGGYASIVPTGGSSRLIRIIGPQALTLAVSGANTGAGAPTWASRAADWLAFTVAENPGDWSAGVAVGIQNVDTGINQKVKFSFSAALIALNVITIIINGVTVSTTYATSNNVTLTALKAAYELAFPGGVADVVETGTANNRQIVFTAPNSTTNLAVTAAGVTLGASQASVTYTEVLKAVASTKSFNVVVYENTAFRSPDETWHVSYASGVDGMGNQLEMGYTINDGPTKGKRLRVYMNPIFSGVVNGATPVTNSNYPRYLGGGANGSLPSTANIVTGYDAFADPEKITVRILINAGYATPEVHQKMINLCEARADCFSVLDTPSNMQNTTDALSYRNQQMNVDSKYGALYSPDILIFDPELGTRRYIPPSGLVAAQYAYTDRVAKEWFAAAGLTRGIIRNALGCRVVYNEGDRDLLSPNQINAIRNYNGRFVIWGEYSTQRAVSPLQSAPAVRLLIRIQTEVADAVAYSLFEPNDAYTRHAVKQKCEDILLPIVSGRGISYQRVVCDETNNPKPVQDMRVTKVDLWFKPILATLFIQATAVVTRQSADFDVLITASNGEI